jgi:hypothetical protein
VVVATASAVDNLPLGGGAATLGAGFKGAVFAAAVSALAMGVGAGFVI